MDVTAFIGDFESVEHLLDYPDQQPGQSAYIVKGGYLYVSVETPIGIDWKQLRVGKGGRGLPWKRGEKGDTGEQGPQGEQGRDGRHDKNGRDGQNGRDGAPGRDAFAVCKHG